MAIPMNLNSGNTYSVPLGFPVRLIGANETMLTGVVPRGATSITATLATESGIANAHLALFTMPAFSSILQDSSLVVQSDLVGLTTKAGQTITLTVPATLAPACYVARLWVDSITGFAAETISRDGVTASASLPAVPTGVQVASVVVT